MHITHQSKIKICPNCRGTGEQDNYLEKMTETCEPCQGTGRQVHHTLKIIVPVGSLENRNVTDMDIGLVLSKLIKQ